MWARTAAHWIAAKELADVVLVDVSGGHVPQGKGSTCWKRCRSRSSMSTSIGTNDYAETANSDIVVITAGIPRKPGMSRDDLLHTNYKIMSEVVGKVVLHSPNAILIIVSNPLDAMAQAASSWQSSTASGLSAWPGSWTLPASGPSLRKS